VKHTGLGRSSLQHADIPTTTRPISAAIYRGAKFAPLFFLPRDAMLARFVLCLPDCLSNRPSQVGVLAGQLKLGSRKQRPTIAHGL